MLHSIAVDNFKPFGSFQKADLAPLTLVYGPNSGGKSSIIQALLLLARATQKWQSWRAIGRELGVPA